MKLMFVSIIMTSLAILPACAQSKTPSEAEARAIYEQKLKTGQGGDDKEIVSFKKINGTPMEFMGVPFYEMEIEAVVKYNKGMNAHCPDLLKKDVEELKKSEDFSRLLAKQIACKQKWTKVIMPGQTETLKDKVTFKKTENGWVKK